MTDTAIDVHNPVDLERKLEEISNRIADGVKVVSRAEKAARDARRQFDYDFAVAIGEATGPAVNHKYQATVATVASRKVAEDAEIAFRYAERQARALEKELGAWQSINTNVRTMYGVAGVGQR